MAKFTYMYFLCTEFKKYMFILASKMTQLVEVFDCATQQLCVLSLRTMVKEEKLIPENSYLTYTHVLWPGLVNTQRQ